MQNPRAENERIVKILIFINKKLLSLNLDPKFKDILQLGLLCRTVTHICASLFVIIVSFFFLNVVSSKKLYYINLHILSKNTFFLVWVLSKWVSALGSLSKLKKNLCTRRTNWHHNSFTLNWRIKNLFSLHKPLSSQHCHRNRLLNDC